MPTIKHTHKTSEDVNEIYVDQQTYLADHLCISHGYDRSFLFKRAMDDLLRMHYRDHKHFNLDASDAEPPIETRRVIHYAKPS